PNGLPGSGDEVDLIVRHARFLDQAVRRGGEQLAEDEVEMADLLDVRFAFVEERVDAAADVARERKRREADDGDLRALARAAGDAHQHGVDGVGGGAGHQADDDARLLAGDGAEALDAVHASKTSRRLPRCASSSPRASEAESFFFAMTVASLTLPSASRSACAAAGRRTPAASSIMRTARLRSFSLVAGMSIIRFE